MPTPAEETVFVAPHEPSQPKTLRIIVFTLVVLVISAGILASIKV